MNRQRVIRISLSLLLFVTFLLTFHYMTALSGRLVAKRRIRLLETSRLYKTSIADLKKEDDIEALSNVSVRYATCHLGASNLRLKEKKNKYVYFTEDYNLDKEPSKSQLAETAAKRYCEDKIVSYHGQLSILHNVVMFPKERSDNGIIGGEKIINVVDQHESKEHYTFRNGFLRLQCPKDSYKLDFEDLRNKWLKTVKIEEQEIIAERMGTAENYVIAIERIDYANLHNWARETFNTFIAMVKFNIQPENVTVLFLDAHPLAGLDHAWKQLFGHVKRIGHLQNATLFKNLIFTFAEDGGAVFDYRQVAVGDIEEYRAFILSRHGLRTEYAKLHCWRITITLIIRRDAVYHPRNTVGHVYRKMFNEAEIVAGLMKAFPTACVQAILFETLPLHLQLEIISQTDVLIGMHGAGLTHIWFLPKHAAVLEIFPKGYKASHDYHRLYEGWARWRGVKHDSWENFDPNLEMPSDYTILPVDVVVNKTRGLIDKICIS